MKKAKKSSILFYIASVLFYLAAILGFISGSHSSIADVWLCLGSANLFLGTVYKKKATEDESDSIQK